MSRLLLQLMLLIGVIIGSVSVAAAQNEHPWTSVGSAGTVDEADLKLFITSAAQAAILADAELPATVLIRYNVVATEDAPARWPLMTVRFRDNGTDARVVTTLRGVSFTTGAIFTVATLDSNNYPPSTDFQTQSVFDCESFAPVNFIDNAYYIETNLTKTSATATPAIQLLKVEWIICPIENG